MPTTNFYIDGDCAQTITYNQASLGAGNGSYYLPLTDMYGNAGCVSPPVSTVAADCNTCDLVTAGLTNIQCNNNGTPNNPADDYITFSLLPDGVNLGTTYQPDREQRYGNPSSTATPQRTWYMT
ncbi:MAG: hypothetical protein IPL27_06465 [Lewinellaceae bacterium]|nr:hypothetical protein [Lewinellaceae bacterium]